MSARTITTAAELDALPVGSVVRSDEREYGEPIYARQADGWFCAWGWEGPALPALPVVVLHDPSVPALVVSDAAVEAGVEAARQRLTWPSLHWGTCRIDPEAWPHVMRAALSAALPHLTVPSAPVPVVSDAAVEAVVRTIEDHAGPLGDPDEGTVCDCGVIVAPAGVYGVWPWREHRARAVLDAVRPLLGAAPSATREEVAEALTGFAEAFAFIPEHLADDLLARFTITPRTDR